MTRMYRLSARSSYREHLLFILEHADTLDLSIKDLEDLLDLTNATACRVHATLRAFIRIAWDESLDR
ncbi:MAG: hypothetical protein JNK05_11755 [Myxococcales bacterium]|nr:hypothetical protein [Myxococcales bacterium]